MGRNYGGPRTAANPAWFAAFTSARPQVPTGVRSMQAQQRRSRTPAQRPSLAAPSPPGRPRSTGSAPPPPALSCGTRSPQPTTRRRWTPPSRTASSSASLAARTRSLASSKLTRASCRYVPSHPPASPSMSSGHGGLAKRNARHPPRAPSGRGIPGLCHAQPLH